MFDAIAAIDAGAAKYELEIAQTAPVDTQESMAEKMDAITQDLHGGQLDFVQDQETDILGCAAGYGAGKTRALCAKAVSLAIANQGHTGIVMEPTGPLIRDIWQPDFEQFMDDYDVSYTFRASPLPEYILHMPNGNTRILCRSFENWQRIIGVNAAFILADEVDTVAPSIAARAFPKILGRLRAGNVRQFGAASTPEGFRWMWETFASDDAKGRTDRRLIKMKTSENPHLPKDFEERIRKNYSANLIEAYLNGEFINLTQGAVYDRFERSIHVKEFLEPVPAEKLILGVDFNVGNCNAIIGIKRPGLIAGRKVDMFYVWDEITGAHDTDALCKEIRRRYPAPRVVHGYPDASGGSGSTNSKTTDIAIMLSYGIVNYSPKANPHVIDRVNAVQAMLENGKGDVRLFIHPRCKDLIRCLEQQAWTEKGEPDKDGGTDHKNDALGYPVHRLFPVGRPNAGPMRRARVY